MKSIPTRSILPKLLVFASALIPLSALANTGNAGEVFLVLVLLFVVIPGVDIIAIVWILILWRKQLLGGLWVVGILTATGIGGIWLWVNLTIAHSQLSSSWQFIYPATLIPVLGVWVAAVWNKKRK